MAAKLGLAFMHGMGTNDTSYADPLRERLETALRDEGRTAGEVVYEPIVWGHVLDGRQRDVWQRLDLDALGYDKLRRFVFDSLGDASGYQWVASVATDEVPVYQRIHEAVRLGLAALRTRAGDADVPIVVVANSLGSHVISNYIWDAQRTKGYPGADIDTWTETEKLSRLAGMVMTGSNIPVLTLPHINPKAFTFPGENLPPEVASAARWLNLYDRDDVLGYPLRSLSASYGANVNEDVEIRIRSWFKGWNPLAHGKYWTDKTVVTRTAGLISSLLAAIDHAP